MPDPPDQPTPPARPALLDPTTPEGQRHALEAFGRMARALATVQASRRRAADAQRRATPARREVRDRRREQVALAATDYLTRHPEASWRNVAREIRDDLPPGDDGERPSIRTIREDLAALTAQGTLPGRPPRRRVHP